MNIGSTAGSTFANAAYGVNQGTEQVAKAAQTVVETTTERPVEGTADLASAMTDMKQGQQATDANAKVLQAADRQLGSLIDTQA
ncbi:flagellar basal body rod C-terminal domain-containing protein [Thalassolituus maritimus]|uniref:Flagellar basal-body/hook protein C-terminal domain-containing protein n=1 Tax=Thalassolituus maritimus TaxID=484498 RepID=A0ABQ0A1G1_9GAMM